LSTNGNRIDRLGVQTGRDKNAIPIKAEGCAYYDSCELLLTGVKLRHIYNVLSMEF
jgi:hypothetical protein